MAERRTIKSVSEDLDKLIEKCEVLKQRLQDIELKLALLQQKTDSLEADISGIFSSFSWVSRAVVGVFIAAVVGFVISGGLAK